MKRSINDGLWFMLTVVFVTLALMVNSCTTESGNQDTTLSDTNGFAANVEAEMAVDEHEGEEEAEHHDEHEDEHDDDAEVEMLMLPEAEAAALAGAPLRVVATTSIIGDIVAQVGDETIDLTVLMELGQDPHSYEPAARALTTVANAHVIFVNGWNLEEGLADDLENIGESALIVPISANIVPLVFAKDDHGHESEEAKHEEEEYTEGEHRHSGVDPHVWFSVHNVEQWVENIEHVLSDLDPVNAAIYEANAAAYIEALQELEAYVETQLDTIPAENRFLVTNHDSFSYFAEAYGFMVLGTVIPAASTVAEPSASDLADLIVEMEKYNVCAIFTETTVNDALAQTVATELDECETVQVLQLYTGAVGAEDSGEDSYIDMFRANVDALVSGLK